MTHYWVISPEICTFRAVVCDAAEPEYNHACVVSVDAPNRRAAKVAAVKHPDMAEWVTEARGDGCNPFTGLTVQPAECPHGVCSCDQCQADHDYDLWCDRCEAERDTAPAAPAPATGDSGGRVTG